jgi:asparagine synthetase B (glutamine-hydrolysing)
MCGIDVLVKLRIPLNDAAGLTDGMMTCNSTDSEHGRTLVARRGPDSVKSISVGATEFSADFFSSVLRIQGTSVCEQPVVNDSDNILCWNGEFLNHPQSDDSDTIMISNMMESTSSPLHALESVEGPFAFVWFHEASATIWFGKDKQGRRTLIFNYDFNSNCFSISSISTNGIEIPAGDGIFSMNLITGLLQSHPWTNPVAYRSPLFLSTLEPRISNVFELHEIFYKSIERHILTSSVDTPIGILFSGGLDSVIIAYIVAEVVSKNGLKNKIQLINVAGDDNAPDRLTGLVSYHELMSRFGDNLFEFILIEISKIENEYLKFLIFPNSTLMDFNISLALWHGGRGEGRVLSPVFIQDPEWAETRRMIIASESTDSASEDRRKKKPIVINSEPQKCSRCELKAKPGCVFGACKLCCRKLGEKFEICSVHVPMKIKKFQICLSQLLHRHSPDSRISSDCRLLFVGHGADELFGGYGRHATRGERGGLEALRSELLLDLSRLWQRNLGRDDRVLGDSGRDSRHPFLDEAVTDWVGRQSLENFLPAEQPPGENKPILRRLCREVLGLDVPSRWRKRAIQFGTRIAQKTNLEIFGSHRKGDGTISLDKL